MKLEYSVDETLINLINSLEDNTIKKVGENLLDQLNSDYSDENHSKFNLKVIQLAIASGRAIELSHVQDFLKNQNIDLVLSPMHE